MSRYLHLDCEAGAAALAALSSNFLLMLHNEIEPLWAG